VLRILFGCMQHKVDGCSTRSLFAKTKIKLEANKMESWFCRVLSDTGKYIMLPAVLGVWSA
jgi:hypothetical protein